MKSWWHVIIVAYANIRFYRCIKSFLWRRKISWLAHRLSKTQAISRRQISDFKNLLFWRCWDLAVPLQLHKSRHGSHKRSWKISCKLRKGKEAISDRSQAHTPRSSFKASALLYKAWRIRLQVIYQAGKAVSECRVWGIAKKSKLRCRSDAWSAVEYGLIWQSGRCVRRRWFSSTL